MTADLGDLYIPDDLLALATPEELALYEKILGLEAASLPDAPQALPDSPGELATLVTGGVELHAPHLLLFDEIHKDCRANPGRKYAISCSPRRGKTRRLVNWGVPWHLKHDPRQRFLYVTYGADLSADSSRWIRDLLRRQDVDLGIRPRRDLESVAQWELEGFPESGMIAVGIDGAVTGKGGHLLCDDLIKNAAEADSRKIKDSIYRALTETFLARLEPGAFALLFMARWCDDDPIGRLMVDQPSEWTFVNIPEIWEGDAPEYPHDRSLGRRVGEVLWPERWPDADVQRLRETNPRFEAQYQGHPERVRRAGGIFSRQRIDRNRWTSADPATFVRVAVAVDPSASDAPDADEAGIVVGAKDLNGHYPILEDASGRMEPDRWARVALLRCLWWDADVLVFEGNLVKRMMQKVIDGAWKRIIEDLTLLRGALERAATGDDPAAQVALDLLLHGRASEVVGEWEVEPLADSQILLALITDRGTRRMLKPRIETVHAKVGKELRAEPVSQLYAQDLVHHVGMFPQLERQLTTWRPGQGSPDRMDSCVHLTAFLADIVGSMPAQDPVGQQVPRPQVQVGGRSLGGYGRTVG